MYWYICNGMDKPFCMKLVPPLDLGKCAFNSMLNISERYSIERWNLIVVKQMMYSNCTYRYLRGQHFYIAISFLVGNTLDKINSQVDTYLKRHEKVDLWIWNNIIHESKISIWTLMILFNHFKSLGAKVCILSNMKKKIAWKMYLYLTQKLGLPTDIHVTTKQLPIFTIQIIKWSRDVYLCISIFKQI